MRPGRGGRRSEQYVRNLSRRSADGGPSADVGVRRVHAAAWTSSGNSKRPGPLRGVLPSRKASRASSSWAGDSIRIAALVMEAQLHAVHLLDAALTQTGTCRSNVFTWPPMISKSALLPGSGNACHRVGKSGAGGNQTERPPCKPEIEAL